eukprot:TRINITY_DN52186_c0_g1_i1.p1 TRINITY_DN52186_c0_g1~~TRINITY_DN52186_c0_g1_i1.p1  ORF type:complete len:203 (+),score=24.89 TRINITY_DN52186_c0_g1_i1:40-648(+)
MCFLRGDGFHYPLEQDVLSSYLFERAAGLWAAFSPDAVACFRDTTPHDLSALKVHHAASSRGGSKLQALYRGRRMYYGNRRICLKSGEHGPQHPCCRIFGHRHSVFSADAPLRRPFVKGTIFGVHGMTLGSGATTPEQKIEELKVERFPDASPEERAYLFDACFELSNQYMLEWQLQNPEKDFLSPKRTVEVVGRILKQRVM